MLRKRGKAQVGRPARRRENDKKACPKWREWSRSLRHPAYTTYKVGRAHAHVAITSALLLLLACSAPAQQSASSPSGTDPAARVGDRTITMKEIEDRWRANNPAEQAQAIQALYDGRRSALEAIIADMLIEQAAKTQGVPPQQYTNEQIAKRPSR